MKTGVGYDYIAAGGFLERQKIFIYLKGFIDDMYTHANRIKKKSGDSSSHPIGYSRISEQFLSCHFKNEMLLLTWTI